MEKDPLFARTLENESLERIRELAYMRVKKLFEYNFLTENEIFQNPLKHQMLTEALGMYDWSMAAKYQLNVEVTPYRYENMPMQYQRFFFRRKKMKISLENF